MYSKLAVLTLSLTSFFHAPNFLLGLDNLETVQDKGHFFDFLRGPQGPQGPQGPKGEPAFAPAYLFAEDFQPGEYTLFAETAYWPNYCSTTSMTNIEFDGSLATVFNPGIYEIRFIATPAVSKNSCSNVIVALEQNGMIVDQQVHPLLSTHDKERREETDGANDYCICKKKSAITIVASFKRELQALDTVRAIVYSQEDESGKSIAFAEIPFSGQDISSPAPNKKIEIMRLQ